MPSTDSLKVAVQQQIAPGDDVEFLRILTEADLRLLEMGKWRWTRSRVDLTPVSRVVTLPTTHVAILGARADAFPMDVRDEDYEFVPEGVGEVDVEGCGGVRLIDQGLDGSDQRTYKVAGKDKDDFTVHTISHYAPFTLYYAADLPNDSAATDSTVTRCPSLAALKLMCYGIRYEEEHDMGSSAHYVTMAMRNLNDRGKARRGSAKQTVNVNLYGPGVAGIKNHR